MAGLDHPLDLTKPHGLEDLEAVPDDGRDIAGDGVADSGLGREEFLELLPGKGQEFRVDRSGGLEGEAVRGHETRPPEGLTGALLLEQDVLVAVADPDRDQQIDLAANDEVEPLGLAAELEEDGAGRKRHRLRRRHHERRLVLGEPLQQVRLGRSHRAAPRSVRQGRGRAGTERFGVGPLDEVLLSQIQRHVRLEKAAAESWELAQDLGLLFAPDRPEAVVFPSEACLQGVLAELDAPELAEIWKEDETLGWIFQYATTREERQLLRDAAAAPRNSFELAVLNQFFTPRYVVEFLADNSLGRLFSEMRPGTRLAERCSLLLKGAPLSPPHGDPLPASAGRGEKGRLPVDHALPPLAGRGEQGGPSRLAVGQPPTPTGGRGETRTFALRDPRDLPLLDPACGSGHFLLYAYDLFEAWYEESWEQGDTPKSAATGRTLREEFQDLESLRRAIPGLILGFNLFGCDIDPRACQVAALALWLRAQRSFKAMGLSGGDRPPVEKVNIVCAEPMPGDPEQLAAFTSRLTPVALGQLVRVIFEKMKLAGEAGPLLKIETEIHHAIETARSQVRFAPAIQQELIAGIRRPTTVQQPFVFDVKGVKEDFWRTAEQSILGQLESFGADASDDGTVRGRLFAGDAASGLGFIDLCRRRYSVILMNPPFGATSAGSKEYIGKVYPRTKNDLYAVFIERGLDLLEPGGVLGAITSRTGFFLSSFKKWREEILMREADLITVADLGSGVLDAMVETAAYVMRKK